jgi:glycosyltransferase involved in cell wall biosynthesis
MLGKLGEMLPRFPGMLYRLGRKRLDLSCRSELYYVTPGANWVTDWIGQQITWNIAAQYGWRSHLTSTPYLLHGHVVHYGEVGAFLSRVGSRCNTRNTVVVTIFHGLRTTQFPHLAENTERFVENMQLAARIITGCRIMERRLVAWGAPSEQVLCIPLGVDLALFKPASAQRRGDLRRELGIPPDAFCIGSFQKDGVGWGEGLPPKLVKGPDVFLRVIERLRERYKLFIVLTAPARGYVKRGLESLGVPYLHRIPANYQELASLYGCLDAYLVASHEEGGPQAALESLASGVPLVSTRVGLVPDVVRHGQNGLLADPGDVISLAESVARLIEEPELGRRLAQNGLETIIPYDWKQIAGRYYRELYLPLLDPDSSRAI